MCVCVCVCVFTQLFNIVVDTEETGKELLNKGRLRKRYTIIPLNKIAARAISTDVIKKAQSLVCCVCALCVILWGHIYLLGVLWLCCWNVGLINCGFSGWEDQGSGSTLPHWL